MPAESGIPRPIEAVKAAVFLILTAPLLLVISIVVLVGSGAPILFRQRRVGRGGNEFTMLKFRTMKLNDQKLQFTSADDGRVTGVGRLLRSLKLDELPELWNVVVGDLSLVGHRPEVPKYVDLDDPLWRQVLLERPGITHPVTLRLADESSLISEAGGDLEGFYLSELLPFKLRGYIDYQEQRGFWQDVKVLVATAASMIGWRWYPAVSLEEVRPSARTDEGRHG
jgi:lipopolysaccharide/colanic/teichoic acid biosynthesis glycosyltransferase